MPDIATASLSVRKQQRTRDRVVAAAYELFAERGFDAVTVTDIAERAEVGRTTFFRYFGDKQEVVFDGDQRHLDRLAAFYGEQPTAPADTLAEALAQLRPIVLAVCEDAVRDPEHWVLHEHLLSLHSELADRSARKFQRYAHVLEQLLTARGTAPLVGLLAAQVALACYVTGRQLADNDPARLVSSVAAALTELQGNTAT